MLHRPPNGTLTLVDAFNRYMAASGIGVDGHPSGDIEDFIAENGIELEGRKPLRAVQIWMQEKFAEFFRSGKLVAYADGATGQRQLIASDWDYFEFDELSFLTFNPFQQESIRALPGSQLSGLDGAVPYVKEVAFEKWFAGHFPAADALPSGNAPTVSRPPSNRPRLQSKWAMDYLQTLSTPQIQWTIDALVAGCFENTGKKVSRDTMRRALKDHSAKRSA